MILIKIAFHNSYVILLYGNWPHIDVVPRVCWNSWHTQSRPYYDGLVQSRHVPCSISACLVKDKSTKTALLHMTTFILSVSILVLLFYSLTLSFMGDDYAGKYSKV